MLNRRNIDIDLFRTFLAAVDLDGLNKAAMAVGRSQSTVSTQIRRMEDALGTPVFEPDGRKVKLTVAGEKLVGYARRLVALHDQALDAVQSDQIDGAVSLAVMGDYATHILPRYLADFMARYPSVMVDVTTGFSSDLLAQLGARFDLVLSTHPLGEGTGERLRVEPTHWVFSATHELPTGNAVPLALLPPGNLFRGWALNALETAGVPWHVLFTSTSIAAVEAAAAAGIAVAVAKESTVQPGLRFLGRQHGFPPLPETEIVLNRSPGRYPAATSALADFLASALKEG